MKKAKPKAKEKKLKERSTELIVEPFGYTVTVIVSDDIHESARRRIPDMEPNANWGAMTATVNSELHSLIFLPDNVASGTIAHESFHVLWHLMRHIGAEFENEVMAYTLGYIVEEVTLFVKGKKRKPRPKTKPMPSRSGSMNILSRKVR